MNTLETSTGEWTAEGLINGVIEERDASSKILRALESRKELLAAEERARVQYYIDSMRPIYAAMIVEDFEGNTAGLYDGSSIYVDREVMMVGQSIDTTVDQAQEVYDHEKYHQMHHHMEPLTVMAETRGDIAAVIGGVEFTEMALIEGLTVMQTGDQFVSVQYVDYKDTLQRAINSSGLTVTQLENAVNIKKNVADIDDRARQPASETDFVSKA